MPHKTGFLSGAEPQEIEEKTEAQKIDERRPAAMAASKSMFDAAEDDSTPAIEQKIVNQDIIGEHSQSSQPKFEIDSFFEQEMKARVAEERAERAKREEEQKKQERQVAKARKEAVKKELEHAQTLDEDELRAKIAEETARSNLQKLYPDAKPLTSDVEDELWRRRTDNGRKAAERAKIESTYDMNLSRVIAWSLIVQLTGAFIAIGSYLALPNKAIATLLYLAGIATIFSSVAPLVSQCNKCKNRAIPSDQRNKFTLATTIPGLALRMIFINLFTRIPITGSFIGCIAGTAIGASFHYQFINRYQVYVSIADTALNTAIYIFIYAFELLLIIPTPDSLSASNSAAGATFAALGFVSIIINIAEFAAGDYAAMRLALYTNK